MSAPKPTRVYLVAEGATELGDLAKEPMYRGSPPADGYAQALLRVVAGPGCPLEFEGTKVALLGNRKVTEPHDALGQKAHYGLALAGIEDAKAIVFLVDVDREPGKKLTHREADRRRQQLREAIEDGFRVARERDESLASITTLVGLPERMIEAWILGDTQALAGRGLKAEEARSIKPEETWGDEKVPTSKHPKCVLARTSQRKLHNGDYAEVAAHTDPERLAERCRRSFAPFLSELRAALDACRAEKRAEKKTKGPRKGA